MLLSLCAPRAVIGTRKYWNMHYTANTYMLLNGLVQMAAQSLPSVSIVLKENIHSVTPFLALYVLCFLKQQTILSCMISYFFNSFQFA